MSDYIVTARKWRPMKFEDVVGQGHVTVTLRNAIECKRLAHAYLFSGPRGVGKTTTARLLAKAVNCLAPQDNNPDNTCEICREITEGRSFDVLEIDGASNRGIDEIRNLRDAVRYPPSKGKYKVYVIDEVHMLTKEAFNALLKTLEEPPSHVLFIFATTEVHKVPATIVSRCQRFEFRRIAVDEIVANLRSIAKQEGLHLDDDALMLIAKRGDGSLRDSQSIFDQVISLCGTTVTHEQILHALNIVDQEVFFKVTGLIKAMDAKGGLDLVDELMKQGHDLREFLSGLAEHFRNILIAKTTGSTALIEASDVYRKRYAEEAEKFSIPDILRLQRMVHGTEAAMRYNSQPRFKLEADMVQMITMPSAVEVGKLVQKLDDLKKKLGERSPTTAKPFVTEPLPRGIQIRPAPNGASQPTRSADQSDSSAVTVSPDSTHLRAQTGVPKRSAISSSELQARWPEFVAGVRQHRISLGGILESATVLGVSDTVIRIRCADDFQALSIKRNKEYLAGLGEKMFGVRAHIEVETGNTPEKGAQARSETNKPHEQPAEEHPLIKALVRELGAEPL
jgi:DNA polymerase-3 subunit gamma/tau